MPPTIKKDVVLGPILSSLKCNLPRQAAAQEKTHPVLMAHGDSIEKAWASSQIALSENAYSCLLQGPQDKLKSRVAAAEKALGTAEMMQGMSEATALVGGSIAALGYLFSLPVIGSAGCILGTSGLGGKIYCVSKILKSERELSHAKAAAADLLKTYQNIRKYLFCDPPLLMARAPGAEATYDCLNNLLRAADRLENVSADAPHVPAPAASVNLRRTLGVAVGRLCRATPAAAEAASLGASYGLEAGSQHALREALRQDRTMHREIARKPLKDKVREQETRIKKLQLQVFQTRDQTVLAGVALGLSIGLAYVLALPIMVSLTLVAASLVLLLSRHPHYCTLRVELAAAKEVQREQKRELKLLGEFFNEQSPDKMKAVQLNGYHAFMTALQPALRAATVAAQQRAAEVAAVQVDAGLKIDGDLYFDCGDLGLAVALNADRRAVL